MDANQQKIFVSELCKVIEFHINKNIDDGKIPDEWDGCELRQLIADEAAYMSHYLKDNKKRYREYTNTVLVNNL
jgi:hypothetical protein